MSCVPIQNGFICTMPNAQPMTSYTQRRTLDDETREWTTTHKPRQLFWCYECRKKRRAENLVIIVQEWYDPMIFCAPNKGCNGPETKRGTRRKRWVKP